jgi:hypothetical protein
LKIVYDFLNLDFLLCMQFWRIEVTFHERSFCNYLNKRIL